MVPTLKVRSVHDSRTVRVDVSGAELLYTPKGNRPIEPLWIEVRYSSAYLSITVCGHPVDGGRFDTIQRNVPYDDSRCPEWLRNLVDRYQPEWLEAR